MSSLLFRNNISPSALAPYLRGYQHELPIPPEEWALAESLGLPAGSLILILEAVTTQPGEGENQDSFKVIELDLVVGVDNERPIVISITGETYELTFLENVMAKRAQDARLTGWDFNYVIVEPAQPLSEDKIHDIEQLGLSFARGGSRRERSPDGTEVLDPANILLTALGLELDPPAARKMLDLGAFGHLVFEPVAADAETPMHRVRETFRPVPAAGRQGEMPPQEVPIGEPPQEVSIGETPLAVSSPVGDESSREEKPVVRFDGAAAAAAFDEPVAEYQDLQDQAQRFQGVIEEKKDDLQKLLGLGGIFSAETDAPAASPTEPRIPSAPTDGAGGEAPRTRVVRPPAPGAQPIRPTGSVTPIRRPLEPPVPAAPLPPPPESPAASFEPPPALAEPPAPKTIEERIAPAASTTIEEPIAPAVSSIIEEPIAPAASSTIEEPIAPAASSTIEEPIAPAASTTIEEPIAPAVSSIIEEPIAPAASTPIEEPIAPAASPVPPAKEAPPALEPIDKTEVISTYSKTAETAKSLSSEPAVRPEPPSVPRPAPTAEVQTGLKADSGFGREARPPVARSQSGTSTGMPSVRAGKLSFQEAAGAQDPMGTLVARLEQQVDKATAKLADQVQDLHSKLEEQLRKLVSKASDDEAKSEQSVTATRSDVCQQLNDVADDTEHKIADCSAQGRYEIKHVQDKGQAAIDEHQKSQLDALQKLCADLKQSSDELSAKARGEYKSLVESRGAELKSLVDAICERMSDGTKADVDRLKQRFDGVKERMAIESKAIVLSFERHVKSLSEDLDAVCERAREKLTTAREQCDLGIKQASTAYELDASRTVTSLLSTVLIPKLREHRASLTQTVSELQKRFAEEFSGLNSSQLTDIADSTTSIKHAVSSLVAESAAKIESTWQQQRSDIGNIFEAASTYMEEAIGKAGRLSQETEDDAAAHDKNSRDLVEQWSSGADPSLLADKDAAIASLNNLKTKAQDNLAKSVESRAKRLEDYTANIQSAVTATKDAQVQSVRETAEQAVQQVRDTLQEAFQAIRATRERYLE